MKTKKNVMALAAPLLEIAIWTALLALVLLACGCSEDSDAIAWPKVTPVEPAGAAKLAPKPPAPPAQIELTPQEVYDEAQKDFLEAKADFEDARRVMDSRADIEAEKFFKHYLGFTRHQSPEIAKLMATEEEVNAHYDKVAAFRDEIMNPETKVGQEYRDAYQSLPYWKVYISQRNKLDKAKAAKRRAEAGL